jgi:hypothetical protein
MRDCLIAIAFGLALTVQSANADELCGEAPAISNQEMARSIPRAVFALRLSSAAGEAFARHAMRVYVDAAKGRSPEEARLIAVALLHGYCVELTQGEDPANLPWHFKDQFVGLSRLIPDFPEAQALLERIKAAEARR